MEQTRVDKLEARVRELKKTVQRLRDLEEIRGVRFHYHSTLNSGKFANCFDRCAEDVICQWGIEIPAQYGRKTVQETSARVMASGIAPSIRQFIHAHLIDLKGDTASATSYMEACPIQFGKSVTVASRWDDKYAKIDGQWWLKHQVLDFAYQVRLDEGWAQEDRVINPFETLDIKSNKPKN